ncbi:hypothetical protein BESB_078500 [Besnoitia besnoiti]|uniref:Uncharacterized protein n=1 Tax=Besnoitia besnoiti TaxID=94643 RepID=A0A2A9M8X3_BESBE|nr:hypothetical protein BESB_078500 [Besnoitia besnoiti]PFH33634.1 hypothetical protein BESB_078500 [Besnoitia besnoiti]
MESPFVRQRELVSDRRRLGEPAIFAGDGKAWGFHAVLQGGRTTKRCSKEKHNSSGTHAVSGTASLQSRREDAQTRSRRLRIRLFGTGARSLRQHSLVVAGVTEGGVTLLTSDYQALHVPAALLPDGLEVGSTLQAVFAVDCAAEASRVQQILQLVDEVSLELARESSSRAALSSQPPSASKASHRPFCSPLAALRAQVAAPLSPARSVFASSRVASSASSSVHSSASSVDRALSKSLGAGSAQPSAAEAVAPR